MLSALALLAAVVSAPTHAFAQAVEKLPGAAGTAAGALVFDSPPMVDFGERYQFEVVEVAIPLHNSGQQPVTVSEALALAPGGSATVEPALIPAGGRATVTLRQELGAALGESSFRFALVSDEPGVARYRLRLVGFVQSAYEPERTLVDFGTIDRTLGARRSVELATREIEKLELRAAAPSWPLLEVAAAGAAEPGGPATLELTIRPGAPLGLHEGSVRVTTNLPTQPTYLLPFRAHVVGDIVPVPHPVRFEAVEIGVPATVRVRLTSSSARPFTVTAIEADHTQVTGVVGPCPDGAGPDCRELALSVRAESPGVFGGVVKLGVAGETEVLPLTYNGFALAPGVTLRAVDLSDTPPSAPAGGAP